MDFAPLFGVRVGVWVQDYTCFGGGMRAWLRFACFEGVQNQKECMVWASETTFYPALHLLFSLFND